MSIQKGQPTSAAAFRPASALSLGSTRRAFPRAYSKAPYPRKIHGWWAETRSGSATLPTSLRDMRYARRTRKLAALSETPSIRAIVVCLVGSKRRRASGFFYASSYHESEVESEL